MRKLLLTSIVLFTFLSASGQKLVIGEKAPDIRVKEWLNGRPSDSGKACLLEFFHSSSRQSAARMETLEGVAKKYGAKLCVIVVAREPDEKVRPVVLAHPRSYHVGLDDGGKTFENFTVQFVPYAVLIDQKGKVVWFGNSNSLDNSTIESAWQ